jgi:hypothetical protein
MICKTQHTTTKHRVDRNTVESYKFATVGLLQFCRRGFSLEYLGRTKYVSSWLMCNKQTKIESLVSPHVESTC